jgi:hypothetical protein
VLRITRYSIALALASSFLQSSCLAWDAGASSGPASTARSNVSVDHGADVDTRRVEAQVTELLTHLETMPPWTGVSWGEMPTREKILAGMHKTASYDIRVIREAVRRLLNPWRERRPEGFGAAMKVFLLNRYLFELPSSGPDSKRCSLWPLSSDWRGKLELTGTFQGWGGGVADQLEMFDRFQRQYGLRKRAGWVASPGSR